MRVQESMRPAPSFFVELFPSLGRRAIALALRAGSHFARSQREKVIS